VEALHDADDTATGRAAAGALAWHGVEEENETS
jgi:hypothetical protein